MSEGQVRAALGLSGLSREAEEQYRKRLKECVDSWLAADSDFKRWKASDSCGLCTQIQEHVQSAQYVVTPNNEGRASIVAKWPFGPLSEFLAEEKFLNLITSTFHRSVRVCRRASCGCYFLSTPRKTTYCSAECATRATAILSTRERRKKELQTKLGKAQRELDKLRERQPAFANWKHRAAKRAGVSLRFLTRHINNRDLKVPLAQTTGKGETK